MTQRILTTLAIVVLLAAGSPGSTHSGEPVGLAAVAWPEPYLIELAAPAVVSGPAPAALVDELPAGAVEIAIAGDVNLGGRIGDLIAANGIDYPWARVRDLLRAADIAVVNLECAVSVRGSPVEGKQFAFRGHPRAVLGMADAGVDVVTVANNHSLDFGRDAFHDTLEHLRRAGIQAVGGGRNLDEAYAPAVIRVRGITVAFVGATRVLPAGFAAGPASPGVASAYEERRLLQAVRAAKEDADVVVVLLHWGVELATQPNQVQVRLARALVEAGASVVAGAHPHVLQPVVAQGEAIVAYSLGNFVFSSGSVAGSSTMLLRVGILPDRSVVAARVPVRIVSGRPVPAGS